MPRLLRRRVTKKRVLNDFRFLEDEYAFELAEVEEPGINDVLVVHYRSKKKDEILICRDRGYYEIGIKANGEYRNIAYECEGDTKKYHEYCGPEGYERLVREARKYLDRE